MLKSSHEIERKFFALDADLRDIDLQLFDIESIYLDQTKLLEVTNSLDRVLDIPNTNNLEIRVSRKKSDYENTYWCTVKVGPKALVRAEAETQIDEYSYFDLAEKFGVSELNKKRFTFNYLRKKFELDIFADRELMLLEVELTKPKELFVLPPFVTLSKDVTGDPSYYGSTLATKIGE